MLNSIEIKGFKSIRDQKVELETLNVLIGANGAGKSNFIQVFDFLRNIIAGDLQLYTGIKGGADRLLYFGSERTEGILVKIEYLDRKNGYIFQLIRDEEDRFIFKKEEFWGESYGQEKPFSVISESGKRETSINEKLIEPKHALVSYIIKLLEYSRIYHFQDTSESAKVKLTADINDNAFYRHDAANLAPYLYLLREKHPDCYREIVSIIKLVAPFFEDFVLRPTPMNENKILLEWKEVGSDGYFNAHSLSDGTLRFICLAVLLLQPTEYLPYTILIDEPEIGLHPYAISIITALIKKAAAKRQVIVSTQSVTLINEFSPEDIIVVNRQDKETVFRRYASNELEAWLDDYSMGDIWEKNIIGGRP